MTALAIGALLVSAFTLARVCLSARRAGRWRRAVFRRGWFAGRGNGIRWATRETKRANEWITKLLVCRSVAELERVRADWLVEDEKRMREINERCERRERRARKAQLRYRRSLRA